MLESLELEFRYVDAFLNMHYICKGLISKSGLQLVLANNNFTDPVSRQPQSIFFEKWVCFFIKDFWSVTANTTHTLDINPYLTYLSRGLECITCMRTYTCDSTMFLQHAACSDQMSIWCNQLKTPKPTSVLLRLSHSTYQINFHLKGWGFFVVFEFILL